MPACAVSNVDDNVEIPNHRTHLLLFGMVQQQKHHHQLQQHQQHQHRRRQRPLRRLFIDGEDIMYWWWRCGARQTISCSLTGQLFRKQPSASAHRIGTTLDHHHHHLCTTIGHCALVQHFFFCRRSFSHCKCVCPDTTLALALNRHNYKYYNTEFYPLLQQHSRQRLQTHQSDSLFLFDLLLCCSELTSSARNT